MFNKFSKHMKKTQIELQKMKITIFRRKSHWMELKADQLSQKKKKSKLEHIAIETIQNETYREKRILKKKALVNCVTTVSSFIYEQLESLKGHKNNSKK